MGFSSKTIQFILRAGRILLPFNHLDAMLEVGGFPVLFLASSLLLVASDHPGRLLVHFIVILLQ